MEEEPRRADEKVEKFSYNNDLHEHKKPAIYFKDLLMTKASQINKRGIFCTFLTSLLDMRGGR
jgi:hypothetical protein